MPSLELQVTRASGGRTTSGYATANNRRSPAIKVCHSVLRHADQTEARSRREVGKSGQGQSQNRTQNRIQTQRVSGAREEIRQVPSRDRGQAQVGGRGRRRLGGPRRGPVAHFGNSGTIRRDRVR